MKSKACTLVVTLAVGLSACDIVPADEPVTVAQPTASPMEEGYVTSAGTGPGSPTIPAPASIDAAMLLPTAPATAAVPAQVEPTSGEMTPAASSVPATSTPYQPTDETPGYAAQIVGSLARTWPIAALAAVVALAGGVWLVMRRRRGARSGVPGAAPGRSGWQSRPPPPGTPYLEGVDGAGATVYIALSEPLVVAGRGAGMDVLIDARFAEHDTVSERHAQFESAAGTTVLVDLKSTNGIFVNGRRTGVCQLADGALVGLGPRVQLTFHSNGKQGKP